MATGFNNTPHSSELRRQSSWGRTRSPKNLIDHRHKVYNDSTKEYDNNQKSVVLLVGSTTSAALNTENQRFLHFNHVMTDPDPVTHADDKACTIQIQVYLHASGVWANYLSPYSSTADNTHTIVEVYGVDRVRFVATGLSNDEVCTIFPACSTF